MDDISFGQHEPLTQRLKAILQDYTDGFAISKELVQNADDAGATQVKFLYDQRQNPTDGLLDPGMAGCQGPALWVYNNATFTDEDFRNIELLSGATKADEEAKIGRFGLGFNAVYHLTDVPSFVSRHYLAIFDPHRTHLKMFLQDKSGIKLDTQKHWDRFLECTNQFQPYNNVFECNLQFSGANYKGTLFRFPLRTKQQAFKSKICNVAYDHKQMTELLTSLIDGCNDLLLFSQSVIEVSIYILPSNIQNPLDMKLIAKVKKEPFKFVRELTAHTPSPKPAETLPPEQLKLVKQSSVLREAVATFANGHVQGTSVQTTMIVKITDGLRENYWLISSVIGREKSTYKGFLPIGSVAIAVTKIAEAFIPHLLDTDGHLTGKMFCFLPLPISAHLPLHINGYFAVMPNRCQLYQSHLLDKDDQRGRWNEQLMSGVVKDAYIIALTDILRECEKCDPELFMGLWPQCMPDGPLERALWNSFYQHLLKSKDRLFTDHLKSGSYKETIFLSHEFNDIECRQVAISILKQLRVSEIVVDLPHAIIRVLQQVRLRTELEKRTISTLQFFQEFFQKRHLIESTERNKMVEYTILKDVEELNEFLMIYPCIPVTPKGLTSKTPIQLIHPYGKAAALYSDEDGRFPVRQGGVNYRSSKMLYHLEKLGMQRAEISWDDIIERAQSISRLGMQERCQRVKLLLQRIETKKRKTQISRDQQDRLRKVAFLPVLQKPGNFFLPWQGDKYKETLLQPGQLYSAIHKNLIGSLCPLIDMSGFNDPFMEMENFLGWNREVSLENVIKQMRHLIQHTEIHAGRNDIRHMVEDMYRYLEGNCQNSTQACRVQDAMKDMKCIWIPSEYEFKLPSKCAKKMTTDARPYMAEVPYEYWEKYNGFFQVVGVKEAMMSGDYIQVLAVIHKEQRDEKLSNEKQKTVKHMVTVLCETLSQFGIAPCKIPGTLYLPDVNGIMQPIINLCYNPNPTDWYSHSEPVAFVHPSISFEECSILGVRTIAIQELSKHSVPLGISFGQSENIINRLNRILSSYPGGEEILKEMIQNADDAEATEIHFIMDLRHHPTEKLFCDSWKHLQGPALCVYNNKPFSLQDIEGIRNLGQGSKSYDPNKTGQYGIGFNSVYNITDTPTILTSVNGREELIALDPHCKYVPEAHKAEPGGRYNNLQELKEKFPDVFSCYDLKEHFQTHSGTLFRFPLRTDEIANASELTDESFTPERLETLMETFKKDAKSVLLFLNNLESIHFGEIRKDSNQPRNTSSVVAELSEEGKMQRMQYTEAVRNAARFLTRTEHKKSQNRMNEIEKKSVTYDMKICHDGATREEWLVVQQIGFHDTENISPMLQTSDEMKLLPRGGVAARVNQKVENSDVYCFLPLPMKADLPVAVNGHFALDHENRWQLWTDPKGGVRTEWNKAVCSKVIASAYVKLLEVLKGRTKAKLEFYHQYFPSADIENPLFNHLIEALYALIARDNVPLLCTVIRKEWLPPTVEGNQKGYFDNLFDQLSKKARLPETASKKSVIIREALAGCRLNIFNCPRKIYDGFIKAKVKVDEITPDVVLKHYRDTELKEILHSQLVTFTPFISEKHLLTLFKYCLFTDNSLEKLQGASLLLGADGRVNTFDKENLKLGFRKVDLFPQCADMFIHPEQMDIVDKFYSRSEKKTDVQKYIYKEITLEELAFNLLPQTIPQEYQTSTYLKWNNQSKDIACIPEPWLGEIWTMIHQLASQNVLESSPCHKEDYKNNLIAFLEPLHPWCLLPVEVGSQNWLMSIQQVKATIDLLAVKCPDPEFERVLRKLNIPKPLYKSINGGDDPSIKYKDNASFVRELVTMVDNPTAMLSTLHDRMNNYKVKHLLTSEDRIILLRFFNTWISRLRDMPESREMLRRLELYPSLVGGLTNANTNTFIVPTEIPEDGFGVLKQEIGHIYIKENIHLKDIFGYLGYKCISIAEFYGNHFFKYNDKLTADQTVAHLTFIMDDVDPLTRNEVTGYLQDVPFIPAIDGNLHCAKDFFDPTLEVFHHMEPDRIELPAPFCEDNWLEFLRECGMINNVTMKQVVQNMKIVCSYCKEILPLMTESYKSLQFFSEHLEEARDCIPCLRDTTCILIEDESVIYMIQPCQLSADLLKSQEIPSYLHKIPQSLAQFQDVLILMGATNSPTVQQYVGILYLLYENTNKGTCEMNAEDKHVMQKSVKQLKDLLKVKSDMQDDIPGIHLPTKDGKLRLSSELILVDDETLIGRLGDTSFLKYQFLDLGLCSINRAEFEYINHHLQDNFKPKMFTDVVKEKLKDNLHTVELHETAQTLQRKFHSDDFFNHLQTLLSDVCVIDVHSVENESRWNSFQDHLHRMHISVLEKVETVLLHDDTHILNSDMCKSFFHKHTSEGCTLYLSNELCGQDDEFWIGMVDFVNSLSSNLLSEIKDRLMCYLRPPVTELQVRSSSFDFGMDANTPVSQPDFPEARRWLRQAKVDLTAGHEDPNPQWACFKYHQAAEKALKACGFAKGYHLHSHDLEEMASYLNDKHYAILGRDLQNVTSTSTALRYPDKISRPKIPYDMYTVQDSLKARPLADDIIKHVECYIDQE